MNKKSKKERVNNKFYGRASLNCSVQGVRGGEAKRKNNVSQVVIEADGKYQLQADALRHDDDGHTRLSDTIITLLSHGRIVFQGTPAQMAIRLHTA